jgi:ribosomal protein S25
MVTSMLRPFTGMGAKNKAEGLFLLNDRAPVYRVVERFDTYEDDADGSMAPSYFSYLEEEFGWWGQKVTIEEAIAFLGQPPTNEQLPDWLQEAKIEEEGDPEMAKIIAVSEDLKKLEGTYGSVMLELACDPDTPSVEVKTMVVIHSFCKRKNLKVESDNRRPSTWVSSRKIAERVGVSRQHMSSILASLEEKGAIDIVRRNRKTSIIYINQKPILTLNPKKIEAGEGNLSTGVDTI